MYDENTKKVIDSRQKCPRCGGEVRLFNVVKARTVLRQSDDVPDADEQKEWRYEMRCMNCSVIWKLKGKPRTQRGTKKMDFTSVRSAIREWNGIARREKKGDFENA